MSNRKLFSALVALSATAVPAWRALPWSAPFEDSPFVKLLAPGQQESLLYVWTGDVDAKQSDFIAVIDANPASRSYGQIVSTAPANSADNETHHFGYTADGSRIFAAGMFSNRLFIFDAKSNPRRPQLIRTVDLAATTGHTGPHSVYAVPDGVLVPMMGGPDGGPPGALIKLDNDGNFKGVVGGKRAPGSEPIYMYDVAVKPELNRMITSSWTHVHNVMSGNTPPEQLGRKVAIWDYQTGAVLQVEELDPLPLSVRWLNRPDARSGFINCMGGNSIWFWDEQNGRLHFTRVIQLPDGSAPADVRIAPDDRFLYVSLFGGNAVQQYDIGDPLHPRLVSSVPFEHVNMLKLSPDGRRLYATNSAFTAADGNVPYRVQLINVTSEGLKLDTRFSLDFERLPSGRARPHDMLFR